MAKDVSKATWARTVLHRLGITPTPGSMDIMLGWMQAEGGHWNNDSHFNPLNTTQEMPGAGNTGNQGNIKSYTSWEQGIEATLKTLKNGNYGGILKALRTGHASQGAAAIAASPWGTKNPLIGQTVAEAHGNPNGRLLSGKVAAAKVGGQSKEDGLPTLTAGTDLTTGTSRQALLLGYLDNRHDPNALLSLAAGLNSLKAQNASAGASVVPTAGGGKKKATGYTGGGANTSATGTANFEGHTVAAWIKPALKYARQQGWKGQVNSGFRSYADQKRIYDSGVRPAAVPGTSNHEGAVYPRGAVDVSDAQQLSAILMRSKWAKKLIYAGAKDTVHFSHPHNGSY